MNCPNRCFEIGGPWISEDPNCPIHGHEAASERERSSLDLKTIREYLELNGAPEEVFEALQNLEGRVG